MTTALVIRGANAFDVTCHLNTEGLAGVTYNVTRITRDAISGRFGAPHADFVDQLETLKPEDEWRNLDRAKVYHMVAQHTSGVKVPNHFRPGTTCSILDIPLLAVETRVHGIILARAPVDGNHRLKGRMLLGMKTLARYVVPETMERMYRVTFCECEVCPRCSIAIRPEGGHMCGSCGRDI